ncbi:protein HESO1-like isoform X1 [Zingiber officinale]|uniref:protein HESO1-like isoform X1 n=1 Tax=Zingiber officinale TaxID=94328 RepID=UPI001C4B8052|nr:protein HESO1-like isoform X1 [Zingiber officinale]XP_042431066.1 protein HESO1-like isoform X1 [Zingiber officinale]
MDSYGSSSTSNNRVRVLESCLRDILVEIKPSESDRVERLNEINQLKDCLRGLVPFGGDVPLVKPFGSFVSNLYTKWGDIDVSVQIDDHDVKRICLWQIKFELQRTSLARSVEYIPNARVPLLKYVSRQHNISFDVSINNHLGVMKSNFLKWLSEIDDRFRDMVLVLKEWAKAQDINDPKSGSLSSYALCLLVIFHFQTCEPPIFPPLRAIINEERISNRGWSSFSGSHFEDVCSANIQRFTSSRLRNQSSLAQLLLSFFDKFSDIRTFGSDYSISTYEGRQISRRFYWSPPLIIEDPFERMENAARTVRWVELPKISNAFQNAHNKLSSGSVLSDRNSLLSLLTRPFLASKFREQQLSANYNRRSQYLDIGVIEQQFENAVRLDRV